MAFEESSDGREFGLTLQPVSKSALLDIVPLVKELLFVGRELLSVEGSLDSLNLGIGERVVTVLAHVHVLGDLNRKLFLGDGRLNRSVFWLKITVEVVELGLGDRGLSAQAFRLLILQIHTEVALDSPLGFHEVAVGSGGLGIKVEESRAHSGASLDVSELPAPVNLLPLAAIADVVDSADFERHVALDASQLHSLIGSVVAVSKEEILVH